MRQRRDCGGVSLDRCGYSPDSGGGLGLARGDRGQALGRGAAADRRSSSAPRRLRRRDHAAHGQHRWPVLDRLPTLRVISNFAVGFDNIDVPAATERGVLVCNTPDVLTNATADHTWSLLLAAARRIPESIDYVREGNWKTWGPLLLLGQEVSGATLGIVGLGRIGKEVAKRARGFDMRVLAFDPFEDEDVRPRTSGDLRPTRAVPAESDFVTLHVALTPETHHLIGAAELDRMKPTAILVNASRGPVVDTDALVAALRERFDPRRRARCDRPRAASGRPPPGHNAELHRRPAHGLRDRSDSGPHGRARRSEPARRTQGRTSAGRGQRR